ncbi:DUF4192 domain-containing protein [Stackebrandtia nassauensis]|uniref:DUF4192 domain-containing protein n=1 Tax=Stackebrandtia nassauensis (strain DSM 44728 / CIP 108903 / NRRL B-16338 / NBRC 102104 / LLR-40K-21) TaxID=446470 RepID=D3Q350_STANL|nr:DUF4192 domain-containing protein [Stackebrandtia nassauensis]ADD40020.1 hypothetical protein Snas_0302 [Stackebrandtia nassauensis DSM 44728]
MTPSCEPPTEPDAADISLSTPMDLLSAIPYLVGYIPADSLVLVGLDAKQITATLRVDLPRTDQPVTKLRISPDVLRRNKVEAAVIAGYGPPERVTRCVDHLRRMLAAQNIELVDALRVTDGTFWSYVCQEPACCPPEGRPVNPGDSPVDAAFTYAGMRALPHRQAVTAQLEPVKGPTRAAVTRATNQVRKLLDDTDAMFSARETLLDEARTILAKATEAGAPLPEIDQTVRLAAALTDAKLQTEAMTLVDSHSPHKMVDLWLWVTRHVAPAFRARPAALLGFAAWRCGNGVLATEAVRRSLTDDPHCPLAMVLGRLLDEGVPPSSIPKITGELLLPLPCSPAG